MVNSLLAKCVAANQRDWDLHLASIAFVYNASTHESTQQSPFFLLHGFQPRWDCVLQLGTAARTKYSSNDYANALMMRLDTAHELARQHLKKAANRMKTWYDRKVKTAEFTVGQQVKILNLRLYPGTTSKWYQKFSDRGTITKKFNDVTYEVKCNKWKPPLRIVHVDKLLRINEFRLLNSQGQDINAFPEEEQTDMIEDPEDSDNDPGHLTSQ